LTARASERVLISRKVLLLLRPYSSH